MRPGGFVRRRRIFNSPFGGCNLKSAGTFQERRPVQAESVAALHVYIDNFSDYFFVAFEHDNLVCACSAHQPGWIGFARTFAKNLNVAAHQTFTRPARRFVDNAEQIPISLFFDGFIDLIRHFRGWRMATRRIAKNERIIKLEFFN